MGGKRYVCFLDVPSLRQIIFPRNFVKARAKDATAKAQRNHFGKQRLGILTKGLSKTQPEVLKSLENTVNVVSRISLAHAQRDLRTQFADTSSADDASVAHANVYATPLTSHKWHALDDSSSASGKTRSSKRSKILNALDMSVRMCPCAYTHPTLP